MKEFMVEKYVLKPGVKNSGDEMSFNHFTVGAGTDPVTTATCAEEGYYLGNKNGKFLTPKFRAVLVLAFFKYRHFNNFLIINLPDKPMSAQYTGTYTTLKYQVT